MQGALLRQAFRATRLFLWVALAALLPAFLQTAEAAVAIGTIAVDLDCVRVVCPPDQLVTTCSDTFTYRAYPIEIIQKCAGAVVPVTVTCVPAPGSPLPIGTTTINCTFSVNQQVVGKCSFNVTVVADKEPPKIICPPDQTVLGCTDVTGLCSAVVNYPAPIASDDSGSVSVTCVPPSGSVFTCGTTVVTCTAIDRCQKVTTCSFKVVVVPGQKPAIKCPPNQLIESCDPRVPINYPAPTVSPAGTTVICNPPVGTFIPLGDTVVTCIASNACGIATCEFIVRVQKKPLPTITCPSSTQLTPLVVACNSNCVPAKYPLPTVLNGALESCTPALGDCLVPGNYVVLCTATNECGRSTCEFVIKVVKATGEGPSIQCPQDIVVATCDPCIPVRFPLPVVLNGTLVGCQPASGDCFKPGTNVVTCVATNGCGISRCQFNVIVKSIPPVQIRCPQDIVVITCNPCEKVEFPIAIANGSLESCTPPSGFCFKPGTNEVVCVATNGCSKDVCRFNVIVRQIPAPVIRCPQDIVVTSCDPCVKVEYPLPVVDNGVLAFCEPPSGTCFKPGTTNSVICLATNRCGDGVRCEFKVIVNKGNPPTIRCPQDILVKTCEPCAVVNYPAPVVVDGTLVQSFPPSGSCFKPGVNIVTCIASNACGRSECKFTVVVQSTTGEPIGITCPETIKVETCDQCAKVTYPNPTVVNGTLASCTPPSGSCFPVGLNVVTCKATNACGQVAECKFIVAVRHKGPPVIKCPDNLVLETCGECAPLAFPKPVVLQGSLVGCNPPLGTCLPIGNHVVVCVATNECGAARCEFLVTVRKQHPIDIKCPRDIVIQTCGDGEVVNYPKPIVVGSDDPTAYDLTCTPPPGSFFPVGTNTVTCCVFDRCSQKRICCTFTIIISKGQACVKPPTQMVLWLPLDEPAGILANNVIAGAPDGIHIGGGVPLPGQKVLNSLSFDGVDDYVAVPNYAAIVMNTSDFSIDAWVLRREQEGRRVIVSKVGPSAPGANDLRGYEWYLNNGVMNLWLGGTTASNINSGVLVPNDGNWHHLAVTMRRSSFGAVRFFLDGVLAGVQGGTVVAPLGNSSRLHVGATSWPGPSSYFRGGIDEVEIFDRQISPSEVFDLWKADRAGKCKIKCNMPWDVHYPADGGPAQALVGLCNCSGVDQWFTYSAGGPIPTTPPQTILVPAGECTNIVVLLGRPTVDVPMGTQVTWTLTIHPSFGCPQVCSGTVINPGPISSTTPPGVTGVPGTNQPVNVPVSLDGLPPGQPVRIRAVGPDMQPDTDFVSINGLPPGTPWLLDPLVALADGGINLNLKLKFVRTNPIGTYTILIETDLDDDGEFNTLSSFDIENPVVTPPSLTIERTAAGTKLSWDDDGTGVLESSSSPDGPWTGIPGARSSYLLKAGEKRAFFRVTLPVAE